MAQSNPLWQAPDYTTNSILLCNWQMLRNQLLQQWELLSDDDLDFTGPNCKRIAGLIARKYGISPLVLENYLRNFERTMPLK